jgi:hypothetical protein
MNKLIEAIAKTFHSHLNVASGYPDSGDDEFLRGRVYEITDLAIDTADAIADIDPDFDRASFLLKCGLKI